MKTVIVIHGGPDNGRVLSPQETARVSTHQKGERFVVEGMSYEIFHVTKMGTQTILMARATTSDSPDVT